MSESPRRFGDLLVELGFVTNFQVQEALALQPLTGHRVGEALLSLGYLTRAQLQRGLALAISRGDKVVLDRPPLGEILVGLKYLTHEQVQQALSQQEQDGRRIGEIAVDLGFCTHAQVYEGLGLQQRMARQGGPPFVEKKEEAQGDAPAAGRRVVVVDDSELSCTVVQQGLTAAGFDCVTFTDPFLALEQIDLLKPDLLLTDLDMPGMNGAELCRRVKESPRGVMLPVVILTANDADRERVHGLRSGADDYVSKGASMEELSARIDGILRRTSETERVRMLFARYTSDAVVEQILQSGEVVLTGERREVTVLFADVRNFTALAETLSPEEVMRSLNRVLAAMADAVLEWGGTLDKYLGDGLMAVWGAPVTRDDDTESAVAAALQMLRAVRQHNGSLEDGPPLELGIGINTGPAVAGSIGSARRTEYTCIGDTVNVASRLCGLAAPGEVLLGEGTAHKLSYLRAVEALPPVKLKGKAQPVPVFRGTAQLEAVLGQRFRF